MVEERAVIMEIVTTTGTREDAERIASVLVEGRLAACVQVSGPVTSTYWWQGRVETAEEWRCSAKTLGENYGAVERAITGIHPYEVPQILAFPVVAALPSYAAWVEETVRLDSSSGLK